MHLCLDSDEPGQAAAHRIAEKLFTSGYKYEIEVPQGKDWNDDLRNPTKSDGNNLLHLVNKYMDASKADPDNLAYRAKAEKYAKIIAKTLIYNDGDASAYGQNAFFYDAAEGLLTAVILLIAEFAPPA